MKERIRKLIEGKRSRKERATIKGAEIARIDMAKRYERPGRLQIEIVKLEPIEGGVVVYARAFHRGRQIGFGEGGVVDIERFPIYNPPILVPDENGDIVRVGTGEDGQETAYRFREDPEEAILQVIEHNISVMTNIHGPKNIQPGRIGSTTSTFYAAAGDGFAWARKDSWSDVVNSPNASTKSGSTSGQFSHIDTEDPIYAVNWPDGSSGNHYGARLFFPFDTSALPDTDTISAATFSAWLNSKALGSGGQAALQYARLVQSTQASGTAIVANDYGAVGSTAGSATDINVNAASTGAYQNLTLNSTGRGWISKTGYTKFALRSGWDITNTQPSSSNYANNNAGVWAMSETSGTTNDPKLVVEHATANAVPTTTTQAASAITSSGATANGNITDTGVPTTITMRGFVYDTSSKSLPGNVAPGSSGYASSSTESGSFGTGAHTRSLSGLSPNTTYYYRAVAQNGTGYAYGEEQSFTTLANLPTVSTGAATSVAKLTATANGSIDATGGANATKRGVVYGTSSQSAPGNVAPGSSGYANDSNEAGSFGTGAFSRNLTGLVVSTTYYYRAYAQNSAGYTYGSEQSFTTQAPDVPTLTTEAITEVETTSAVGNMNITDDGDESVDVIGFVYDTESKSLPGNVAPASSGYAESVEDSGGPFAEGAHSIPLTGLPEETVFYVRAYAQNAAGYAYGDEETFNTPYKAPTITSVSPAGSPLDVETPFTLYGTEFMEGATITIDGELCTEIEFVDEETLTAVAPSRSTSGLRTLVVENPDGKTASTVFAYMEVIPEPAPAKTVSGSFAVEVSGFIE